VIRLLCLHLLRLQLRCLRFPPALCGDLGEADLDDLDALDGEALCGDLGDLGETFGGDLSDLGETFGGDLGDLGETFGGDLGDLGETLGLDFARRSTIFIKSQFEYCKSFIHPNSKINVFKNAALSCCSGVHFSGNGRTESKTA
jgi:hypothetical protein